jgi:hypothetical protein
MYTHVFILVILSALFMIIGAFLDLAGRRRFGSVSKRLLWVSSIYLALIAVVLQSDSGLSLV